MSLSPVTHDFPLILVYLLSIISSSHLILSIFFIETAHLQMILFIIILSFELCSHSQKYVHMLSIAHNLIDTVALQIHIGSVSLSHLNYNG